ncbi:hypothetical protein CPT_Slocum_019 [Serratia phage Slocum]|nr:hypothetical protein CPT_Slocum_019 [Serratia phage Slocum]URC22508.1 hypothetical protein KAMAJI_00800 [Serratia phage vB_SmaM-Kamaji]
MTKRYRGARITRVIHKQWINKLVPVNTHALYYGRLQVEEQGYAIVFTPDEGANV